VGSPKFPKPALSETLIPKKKTLYLLGSSFIHPVQVLDPSSVIPPSCLPYARIFHLQNIPTYRHKSQTPTPDSISLYQGPRIVSLIFALLPDRRFCLEGELWVEGGMILGNWYGNGSSKHLGMEHELGCWCYNIRLILAAKTFHLSHKDSTIRKYFES
jgi:hypothetical protein